MHGFLARWVAPFAVSTVIFNEIWRGPRLVTPR
jgi:hypothetical protein